MDAATQKKVSELIAAQTDGQARLGKQPDTKAQDNHKANKDDEKSGGQDTGVAAHGEANTFHHAFLAAVEKAHDEWKLEQTLTKLGNVPIGHTSFTRHDVKECFAIQSLTGHIVTNFQQEFASEKPPSALSVHQLAITERDGRILLTTPEGTALVNRDGKPVMATELGSYLHRDGTVMVDGAGRLHQPGDQQGAHSTAQEQLTAAHKKESEKVRVRQQMEAALDSVSPRDALAESMLAARPEFMQAIIDSAEASVKPEAAEDGNFEAVLLARRVMEDDEIDHIADSEFDIDAEQTDINSEGTSSDVLLPIQSAEKEENASTGTEDEEDEPVADDNQREVLSQGQAAILAQQGTNGSASDPSASQPDPTTSQTDPSASQTNPGPSQTDPSTTPTPGAPAEESPPPPNQIRTGASSNDTAFLNLEGIEQLMTDLSDIVATASSVYDSSDTGSHSTNTSARPSSAANRVPSRANSTSTGSLSRPPSTRQTQADTLPLPAMRPAARNELAQRSGEITCSAAPPSHSHRPQITYTTTTSLGEVISVSTAHVVTSVFL